MFDFLKKSSFFKKILNYFVLKFAMFGAPKNDIDFSKIFSNKNILVKSPYLLY